MIASYRSRGYKDEYLKVVDLDAESVSPLYEESVDTSIVNFEFREVKGLHPHQPRKPNNKSAYF